MKAKRNRYDLSLWDVRKRSLYGRVRETVQVEAAQFEFLLRCVIPKARVFSSGPRDLGWHNA
jgi:hypothetical protein